MEPIGAAAIYDIAGAPGELLLALLIAFGLGALFGRTILTPPVLRFKQPSLFLASKTNSRVPKKTIVPRAPLDKDAGVIVTPAPRSSS